MATIVIDFDGTIAENKYPEIGDLKSNVKEVINKLFNDGHDIVINTCRAGELEDKAKEYLIENNIPFMTINKNLPKYAVMFGMDCRKMSGDIYIDDKQLGGIPDDWNIIYKKIQKQLKNLK